MRIEPERRGRCGRNDGEPGRRDKPKPVVGWVTSRAATRKPARAEVFFAVTLFVSAALLFAVEPMFAKMVLPLLGGARRSGIRAWCFIRPCCCWDTFTRTFR